ncbi:MAG: metallophosphoesterase [Dysosmobacter sp.]
MIASDLHGSAHYCRLLLEAFRREGAQRLVLLGDLLYQGTRNPLPREYDPPAVTAMLNEAADKLLCVRGNYDADVDQMVLQFPILGGILLPGPGGRHHLRRPRSSDRSRRSPAPSTRRLPAVRPHSHPRPPELRHIYLSQSRAPSPFPRRIPPTAS